ncbi:hypothetical protein HDV01_007165 [Terramyces sp. JEL0728]|nr:hypothetical protein HDV01_007165 [Terramyces sp. JEL0728]
MIKLFLVLRTVFGLLFGNGIFVYPKNLNTSRVVADLSKFNTIANANSVISSIYLYTGSVDYNQKWIIPFNNSTVSSMLKIPKVKQVLYLFDNALLLNDFPYQMLGYRLVLLVCQSNHAAGLALDLEPLSQMIEFTANLVKYMNPLLTSTRYNCKNKFFPNGRVLSIYGPVKNIKPILSGFRPNNYFIVNGYDLYGGLAYSESPAQYGQLLRSVINQFQIQSTFSIYYTIIIPAAASTNEFSYYLRNGKSLANGFRLC